MITYLAVITAEYVPEPTPMADTSLESLKSFVASADMHGAGKILSVSYWEVRDGYIIHKLEGEA